MRHIGNMEMMSANLMGRSIYGRVAKLAAALVLETSVERRAGASPVMPTILWPVRLWVRS